MLGPLEVRAAWASGSRVGGARLRTLSSPTVRPEQAEHGSGLDREVDPVQRPGLAEPLDQPVSND